jgi:type IV pilus assembly protein PilN
MAHINLLPWREERRQELKKEFLVTLALVFTLGVGLVLLADRVVNSQIDNQKARNQYLTENIKELDKIIAEIRDLQKRRNQLLDRMRVIQELQGNRPIIENKVISINGVAESNNRVSSLMRRLDGSDWLADPNLDKVKAAPNFGDQATIFDLTVKVQAPATTTDIEQSGKG